MFLRSSFVVIIPNIALVRPYTIYYRQRRTISRRTISKWHASDVPRSMRIKNLSTTSPSRGGPAPGMSLPLFLTRDLFIPLDWPARGTVARWCDEYMILLREF